MAYVRARTAREALTDRRLYKFRSLADETQRQRLRDIVLDHRIRFSRPSELNDPIEGKPLYALGDWNSEAYRKAFAQWAWQGQRHVPRPPSRDAFIKWILEQSQEVLEQHVASINADNHAAIEQKWRVLSLSATSRHDLMWSHYADGHKGVALVFDASQGEFALAYQVAYAATRRSLDITTEDLMDILRATLLSKRLAWAYEEEFRCIAPETWEPDTLRLQSQFLEFAPAQLLGIILGAKISANDEDEIAAWVTTRESKLTLWKAKIDAAGSVEIHLHAP